MAGIVGVAQPAKEKEVEQMLSQIAHRGPAGRAIFEVAGTTLGIVWTKSQQVSIATLKSEQTVSDSAGEGHLAAAKITNGKLVLTRDPFGVAPLYYGWIVDGTLCFASEVKALLEMTDHVHELPPGHRYDGNQLIPYFHLQKQPTLTDSPEQMAKELHKRLINSVQKRSRNDVVGSWLSGGLDSSTIAALARPQVRTLYTFAAGLLGAPDLEYARAVAAFIQSEHHEIIVNIEEMLTALPEVIFHLESFDALLVRSSITNYLVAKLAADYVTEVFSGEGGDELFAGYDYLKSLHLARLPDELIDITNRLHNTALQRVDRSASAHGTVAHVAFLDPEVVDYALQIPIEYKLNNGVEKWILRQAMAGLLPQQILNRKKAKFWEGAGVGDLLARNADRRISDSEFNRERTLPNGWILNSKEELSYYRIFREHFGNFYDLSWMGRTKWASTV